jgi:hypothetical protein
VSVALVRARALLLACAVSARVARAEAPAETEAVTTSAARVMLDLRKIVELQEATGWKIDRYEFEAMMPNALLSLCAASGPVRAEVVAKADRAEADRGGPSAQAVEARGGSIAGLDDLLSASRVARLAREAVSRAPSECPPWARTSDRVQALQNPVDRWFLVAEGGGQATIQIETGGATGDTSATLGGGGGGRLLVGRAIGDAWSIRFGPDISAKALVKRTGDSTSLPLQFQGALPVVVRLTRVSWFTSGEIAPIVLAVEGDERLRGGGRLGLMVGRSALQVRGVVPWAGLGAEVEYFPTFDERPTLVNVKGGLRAGLDWML